jgi:hypothetical protein
MRFESLLRGRFSQGRKEKFVGYERKGKAKRRCTMAIVMAMAIG